TGEFIRGHFFWHIGALRVTTFFGIGRQGLFQIWSIASYPQGDAFSNRYRVDRPRINIAKVFHGVLQAFGGLFSAEIEASYPVLPIQLAGSNLVQIVFHSGGELVVNVATEVFFQ